MLLKSHLSRNKITLFFAVLAAMAAMALATPAISDTESARANMENQNNPLMLALTSAGEIFLELFPAEAPDNVANFINLAQGTGQNNNAVDGDEIQPPFYDNSHFNRVVPGFLIQAGNRRLHPAGDSLPLLDDEINASWLGLDLMKAILPDKRFNDRLNISNKEDFDQTLLIPLYRKLNIHNKADLADRQAEIVSALQEMTLKQAYENLGYHYRADIPGREIIRGIVALSNEGPDTNGPEFFISIGDAPWLTGRYTVIGNVVEGMNVVDRINAAAIDSVTNVAGATFNDRSVNSRSATTIFSLRRVPPPPQL